MMLQVPSVWHHPQGMRLRGLGDNGDSSGSGDTGETGDDSGGFGYNQFATPEPTGNTTDCPTDASGNCITTPTTSTPLVTNPTYNASQCAANGMVPASDGSCVFSNSSANASGISSGALYNNSQACQMSGGSYSGGNCMWGSGSFPPGVVPTSANTQSGLTSFLNALASNAPKIAYAITGAPATSAACMASGGTWNAATGVCTPGIGSYMPILLLVAGVGLVFMFAGGKH